MAIKKINWDSIKSDYSVDLKKIDGVEITYLGSHGEENLGENLSKVYLSGSTLYIKVSGDPKLRTFKNFKSNKTIYVHTKEGDIGFQGNFGDFLSTFNTFNYDDKKYTLTATAGDDVINVSTPNYAGTKQKGYTINAGKGNDTVTGTQYKDTINGGAGDDTINATLGNDVITGGKGTNTVAYSAQNFGDDTIKLTKGETLNITGLDFDGIEEKDKYTVKGNDLYITSKYGHVTVKNYAMKNTGATVKIDGTDQINAGEIYFDKDDIAKATITGTNLSDSIDATGAEQQYKTVKKKKVATNLVINAGDGRNEITGSAFGDTINAGEHSDKVYATSGNDTYKLGRGWNDIYYNAGVVFNNDTMILTKNENLRLQFDYDIEGENGNIDFKRSGNDCVFTCANGTITIKDYYSKDLEAHAHFVYKKGATTKSFDAKGYNRLFSFDHTDVNKKGVLTASALSDEIDLRGMTKPVKTVKGVKYGATINAGGGYDQVYGSDFNDTINGGEGVNYLHGEGGDDIITGGNGMDIITGDDGNDIINGKDGIDSISGGKGNDTLTGGSGGDTFYFNSGDGVDVITDATLGDVIWFSDAKSSNLRYAKNGNNLEIYYDSAYDQNNKVTVQNYYKTKAENRVKTLRDSTYNATDLSTVDVTAISGSGKINGNGEDNILLGSAKADTIKGLAGDDDISAYAGNDNIYGGKGNDIINAGTGKNNIYYSLGDGDDTILYGGGSDTLVFDKGTTVNAVMDDDDLLITYSGKKNKVDYENTITVENYKNNKGVESVKIGKTTKTVADLLGGYDSSTKGAKTYKSTSKDEYWMTNYGTKLTKGNHIFVYDKANTDDQQYPHFGYDIIETPNTSKDSYKDTLQFKGSFTVQHGLEFDAARGELYTHLWSYDDDNEVNGNIGDPAGVIYYDLTNKPKVIVKDAQATYNVLTSNGKKALNNSKLKSNSLNLVEAKTYDDDPAKQTTATVISNGKGYYNYTATHNVNLNYTYNGAYDKINTYDNQNTNDTYNIASMTTNSHLVVRENGGNDTLKFTKTNADNLRVLFNVSRDYADENKFYVDKRRTMFVLDTQSDDLIKAGIKAVSKNGYYPTEGGVYVYDHNYYNTSEGVGIENLVTKDVADIDEDAWYTAVAKRVGEWLKENNEHSVESVLWGPDADQNLNELIELYKGITYSDSINQRGVDDDYDVDILTPQATVTGTAGNDTFTSASIDETFNLSTGNDTVTFGKVFSTADGEGDHIHSESVAGKGNTDTLIFTDHAFTDELNSLDASFELGNLHLQANSEDGTYSQVYYHDVTSGDTPNVNIIDKTGNNYEVKTYDTAQGDLDHREDNKNGHIEYINAESGANMVYGNKKYNYLQTEGGADLTYSYSGGHDIVVTSDNTNDNYYINNKITTSTSLSINDAGGDDLLYIMDSNTSDLRMFVDVKYNPSNHQYGIDKNNIAIAHRYSFTDENLVRMYSGLNSPGIHSFGEIETIATLVDEEYVELNVNAWYNAVRQSVAGWLGKSEFNSASEAIAAYNNDQSVDISGLVAAYTNVNYSEIAA